MRFAEFEVEMSGRPGKFQHYNKFSSELCSQDNKKKDLMAHNADILNSKRFNNE